MFWFLAFALAWAITVPLATNQLGYTQIEGLRFQFGFAIGLAPAIAAIVASAFEKRFKDYWRTAWNPRAPVWLYLLALSLPCLLLAVPFAWAAIRRAAPPELEFGPDIAAFAAVWLVLALGEELGWRSYALPRLTQRFGFLVGTTILGVIWCVWHYPKMLSGPFVESIPQAAPFIALFSLQIVIANYIICWIAARARFSSLPTTVFHTAFNTVSTVYGMAAMDPSITAVMAIVAIVLLIIDRRPQGAGL